VLNTQSKTLIFCPLLKGLYKVMATTITVWSFLFSYALNKLSRANKPRLVPMGVGICSGYRPGLYYKKSKFNIWFRTIALTLICFILINNITWAYPDNKTPAPKNTLAVPSRFNEHFRALIDEGIEHSVELEFELIAGVRLLLSGLSPVAINGYLDKMYTETYKETRKITFLPFKKIGENGSTTARFHVAGKEDIIFEIYYTDTYTEENIGDLSVNNSIFVGAKNAQHLEYIHVFQKNDVIKIRKIGEDEPLTQPYELASTHQTPPPAREGPKNIAQSEDNAKKPKRKTILSRRRLIIGGITTVSILVLGSFFLGRRSALEKALEELMKEKNSIERLARWILREAKGQKLIQVYDSTVSIIGESNKHLQEDKCAEHLEYYLNVLPRSHTSGIKKIAIVPEEKRSEFMYSAGLKEAAAGQYYHNPDNIGGVNIVIGAENIGAYKTSSDIYNVPLHEIGHYVYYNILSKEQRLLWNSYYDKNGKVGIDFVSEYAKNEGAHEDFAETYAAYCTNSIDLIQTCNGMLSKKVLFMVPLFTNIETQSGNPTITYYHPDFLRGRKIKAYNRASAHEIMPIKQRLSRMPDKLTIPYLRGKVGALWWFTEGHANCRNCFHSTKLSQVKAWFREKHWPTDLNISMNSLDDLNKMPEILDFIAGYIRWCGIMPSDASLYYDKFESKSSPPKHAGEIKGLERNIRSFKEMVIRANKFALDYPHITLSIEAKLVKRYDVKKILDNIDKVLADSLYQGEKLHIGLTWSFYIVTIQEDQYKLDLNKHKPSPEEFRNDLKNVLEKGIRKIRLKTSSNNQAVAPDSSNQEPHLQDVSHKAFRFPKHIWQEFKPQLKTLGGNIYEIVKTWGLAWTDEEGHHWIDDEDQLEKLGLTKEQTETVWNIAMKAINEVAHKNITNISDVREAILYHEYIHSLFRKNRRLLTSFKQRVEKILSQSNITLDSFIEAFREIYGSPALHEAGSYDNDILWYLEEFLTLSIQETELFEKPNVVLERLFPDQNIAGKDEIIKLVDNVKIAIYRLEERRLRSEHRDEKTLSIRTDEILKGHPVNMTIDLSPIPRERDGLTKNQADEQLNANMESLALLIAWHKTSELNICYILQDIEDSKYEERAIQLLTEKLAAVGKSSNLDWVNLVSLINNKHQDKNTIEIMLRDVDKVVVVNNDRTYQVALGDDKDTPGISIPNYMAAASIGLALATLRILKDKNDADYITRRKTVFNMLSYILKRYGVLTEYIDNFTEDVLEQMVSFPPETRASLAIAYALKPAAKAPINMLPRTHKLMQQLKQAA